MRILTHLYHLPLIAVSIALVALLVSCGGGPDIALNGTIIDAYTGQPVPAATIKLGSAQLATEATSQPLNRTVSFDTTLRPNILTGTITDRYTGQPLAGATVKVGDTLSVTTGADGKYRLEGMPSNATVQISADGYAALTQPLEK